MPIPSPEPGLVISYAYLWHYEHQAGREEGQKDCPSVIVLAIEPISRILRHHRPHTPAAFPRPASHGRCRPENDQQVAEGGVLEKGVLHRTTGGTPQGGVISPLLANLYLHYVLDGWFEKTVRLRLKGRCQPVRYADDAVVAFEDHLSGKRLLDVLGKRLGRFGLRLHPTKTRFVDFRFRRPGGRHPATAGTTLDFLGLTHAWGMSRNGKNVVPARSCE